MNLRRTKSSRSGFTLIELLVVTAITAMLSSLMITYNSTSRQQIALTVESAKITQVILKAKSLSLSTFNQPEVPCGYGLHLDYSARTYSLISYAAPFSGCGNLPSIDPSLMGTVETFSLSSNLDFVEGNNKAYDLLFVPPEPRTLLWVDPPGLGAATSGISHIYLRTKNGSISSTISINNAGQVTF